MNHEFRCPVCSHAGQVSLPPEGTARVRCVNCDAALVVKEADPEKLLAEARLADGAGPSGLPDDGAAEGGS